MKLRIKHGSRELALDVPLSIDELTFETVIDFKAARERYLKESVLPELEEGEEHSYTTLVGSLEKVLAHKLNAIKLVCSGPIHILPWSLEGDGDLIGENFQLNLGDELSLDRLYAHIVNMIELYEPTVVPADFSIVHHGVKYTIDPREAFNTLMGVSYTAGEALTILELRRQAYKVIDEKGDLDGNLAFNLGIREVCLLLREPGVEVPAFKAERNAFIDAHAPKFRDLSYDIVLNIRFFFLFTIQKYARTKLISSFLKAQVDKEKMLQKTKRY